MTGRNAIVKRETKETTVKAEWNLDGSGNAEGTTGIRMLDHLVSQIASHGVFDIKVSATGDDIHHVARTDDVVVIG